MTRLRSIRSPSARSFVACEVGATHYVFPVEQVQEVLQPLSLTPLPHAPLGVIGAVEHRDVVVPVLDLSERLGLGTTDTPRRKWVVMKEAFSAVAIVVHRVIEVFDVNEMQLRPAPDVGESRLRGASHVIGYGEGIAYVMDFRSVAELATIATHVPELPGGRLGGG